MYAGPLSSAVSTMSARVGPIRLAYEARTGLQGRDKQIGI